MKPVTQKDLVKHQEALEANNPAADPAYDLGWMYFLLVVSLLGVVVWLAVFFPLALPFAFMAYAALANIRTNRRARRINDLDTQEI